jgi:ElaB/YqjD/DUF883 family membrane-anchored ribosome-binding protein
MQDTTAESSVMSGAEKGAGKIEHLTSRAHDAVERMTDAASSALHSAGERGQEWITHPDELLEGARDCVRRHPVASVMIAVGVGLLFSRMTHH